MIVHQLPEWEDLGIAPSIEYRLPADGLPEDCKNLLPHWLSQFSGCDASKAKHILDCRWADYIGVLSPLKTHFTSFIPSSIVIQEQRSWLLCLTPELEDRERGQILVPEQAPIADVARRLCGYGMNDPLLAVLISGIAGLRESFYPEGGAFLDVRDEWSVLDESLLPSDESGDEWKGSLCVFKARNGDVLMRNTKDRFGWLSGNSDGIRGFASNIADFAERYVEYRRRSWASVRDERKLISWPFDSFGPPSRFALYEDEEDEEEP